MDTACEWLDAYAAERPALAEALRDGALARRAKRTTLLWHRACDENVAKLRRSEPMLEQARVGVASRVDARP